MTHCLHLLPVLNHPGLDRKRRDDIVECRKQSHEIVRTGERAEMDGLSP